MKKIGVILLGCCLGALLSASVATAGPKGECNRILAKEIGQAEKIHNGVDTAASCVDLIFGLVEFASNPACIPLLFNGDLFLDPDSPILQDTCDALLIGCGIPPQFIPPGICPS